MCVQAVEELEAAAASGLQPLRYVGAPMPHWHQPLLLMHAVARSQWPQPLLGEAAAAALMAFAGACVERLQAAPATAPEDSGEPPAAAWLPVLEFRTHLFQTSPVTCH